MPHQPLIVAKPPWYRRSLRGWNPFGWRSLKLGQERYTGLMLFPDGFDRPGDGIAPPYVWDDEGMAPARKDGGAIIDPELEGTWYEESATIDPLVLGCVYKNTRDVGVTIRSEEEYMFDYEWSMGTLFVYVDMPGVIAPVQYGWIEKRGDNGELFYHFIPNRVPLSAGAMRRLSLKVAEMNSDPDLWPSSEDDSCDT